MSVDLPTTIKAIWSFKMHAEQKFATFSGVEQKFAKFSGRADDPCHIVMWQTNKVQMAPDLKPFFGQVCFTEALCEDSILRVQTRHVTFCVQNQGGGDVPLYRPLGISPRDASNRHCRSKAR